MRVFAPRRGAPRRGVRARTRGAITTRGVTIDVRGAPPPSLALHPSEQRLRGSTIATAPLPGASRETFTAAWPTRRQSSRTSSLCRGVSKRLPQQKYLRVGRGGGEVRQMRRTGAALSHGQVKAIPHMTFMDLEW